jgi:hypothetical protein
VSEEVLGRAAHGGYTCAEAEQGTEVMAAGVSRLREERNAALRAYDAEVTGRRDEVTRLLTELRGEREKYRQVVEINHANQRSYWAETDKVRAEADKLRAELDAAHAYARDADAWRAGLIALRTCRRCVECRDQPHHWLTSMPECPEGGEPFIPCKHCDARAGVCGECAEGAVWPPDAKLCELCNAPGGV